MCSIFWLSLFFPNLGLYPRDNVNFVTVMRQWPMNKTIKAEVLKFPNSLLSMCMVHKWISPLRSFSLLISCNSRAKVRLFIETPHEKKYLTSTTQKNNLFRQHQVLCGSHILILKDVFSLTPLVMYIGGGSNCTLANYMKQS